MTRKKCSFCKTKKVLNAENFPTRSDRPGRFQSYCHACAKTYKRKKYLANRDEHVAKAIVRNRSSRLRNRQFLFDYLKDKSCSDCGETDPIVLEFDHDDPKLKSFQISQAVNNSVSTENIMKEIMKCTIRCANCHRRRTAKQFKWFKSS